MNFEELKFVYAFFCVVLGFALFSPVLAVVVPFPAGEEFSELWLLGSNRMLGDYPFSVSEGEMYKVYLGVGNHLGDLSYYRVYVKFRNESEPLPERDSGLPSTLQPICAYDLFLRDNETWEIGVSFSFEGISFDGAACRIHSVSFSGTWGSAYVVDVNKIAMFNETSNAFYCQLFFELWLYNATVSDFQFHNRWVGIWLNMSGID